MMDVLQVAFPHPPTFPELEPRARVSAWGTEEDPQWFWRGHLLGHFLSVAQERWATYLPGLPTALLTRAEPWSLLRVAPQAVASYERLLHHAGPPELDLGEVFERLLRAQPAWGVWCERDVDQHPVDRGPMTPSEVVARLRENVLRSPAQRDFVAWSQAAAEH